MLHLRCSRCRQWSSTCSVSGFRATPTSKCQRQAQRSAACCNLEASTALARSRAAHSIAPQPLFQDPFAEALGAVSPAAESQTELETRLDVVATRHIDEQLLTALNLVNMDLRQEYRQVVLLGCGMDTRPYRLLWPEGTIIFEISPLKVLEQSMRLMKEQHAHVPRGCLLRRVPCDLQAGEDFSAALERCGYQADRLSIWGTQGLEQMGLSQQGLKDLFTHISLMAAFDSIVLGELPSMPRPQADSLLAEHSLLGRIIPFGGSDANYDLLGPEFTQQLNSNIATRRLFTSQHKQLSIRQNGTYSAHVQAAEDTDEDFFGNFS